MEDSKIKSTTPSINTEKKKEIVKKKKEFIPPTFIEWVDFMPNKNTFGIKTMRLGFYVPSNKYRKFNGMRVAITTPQLMTCYVKEDGTVIYNAHINWDATGNCSDLVNFIKAYIELFDKPKVKKFLSELGYNPPKVVVNNIVSVDILKEISPSEVEDEIKTTKEVYNPEKSGQNICDKEECVVTTTEEIFEAAEEKEQPEPQSKSSVSTQNILNAIKQPEPKKLKINMGKFDKPHK